MKTDSTFHGIIDCRPARNLATRPRCNRPGASNTTPTRLAVALTARRTLFSTLPIAVMAVVCAGEAFAFSGNWNYSWGDTKYSFANIGTASGRTCFLSGMTGNISPFSVNQFGGQTGVGVRINGNNNYELYVDSDGGALGVYARCVNSAVGRTAEVTWRTGQAAKVLGAVTANRRCFLTSITTSNQYGENSGFRYGSDYVRVWKDSTNWYVGGIQSGTVWGSARCIDVSEDHGGWQWIAGDPGTRKDPLAYNPGGVTCLLTGVGGRFNKNDWADGAFVTYDAGVNQFFMNTKNGKTGWANCVK